MEPRTNYEPGVDVLTEGADHKRLSQVRGPSTEKVGGVRSGPGAARTIPLLLSPEDPNRPYSAQIRYQNEEKNHPPKTIPAPTDEN
jgi:hypothetical protein